jgi:hypothetical protein
MNIIGDHREDLAICWFDVTVNDADGDNCIKPGEKQEFHRRQDPEVDRAKRPLLSASKGSSMSYLTDSLLSSVNKL